MTSRDKAARFAVVYHNPFRIGTATLDAKDIIVSGPNGFSAHAEVVSSTRGKHRSTRLITYAVHGPSDNGGRQRLQAAGRWRASSLPTNSQPIA